MSAPGSAGPAVGAAGPGTPAAAAGAGAGAGAGAAAGVVFRAGTSIIEQFFSLEVGWTLIGTSGKHCKCAEHSRT